MPPAVVIHVPHSSTEIPEDASPPIQLSPDALQSELLATTDHYTDALFALPPSVATPVRFPISRLVVDPERFTDDAQETMAKVGMGVIYTKTSNGERLRPEPTPAERAALLQRYYEPHHAALTAAVSQAVEAHGQCLVIDAHSFPSRPLPYELDQRADRPEICIGTDAFHTPDWLRERAVSEFEREGFTVAVDRPFAGALVPMAFYGRDARVGAFMVELNRGLYMDERTGERSAGFGGVQGRLLGALRRVIEAFKAGRG